MENQASFDIEKLRRIHDGEVWLFMAAALAAIFVWMFVHGIVGGGQVQSAESESGSEIGAIDLAERGSGPVQPEWKPKKLHVFAHSKL